MFEKVKYDLSRLVNKDINIFSILKLYYSHLGARAVILFRIQDYFFYRKKIIFAKLIRNKNLRDTGAEFCLGCNIGRGLVIKHPNGIVIGAGTIIGYDCTLLQQVTLGEDYKGNNHLYPLIKDNVTICSGAKILGGVTIGNGSLVGANAVVTKNFSDNSVIVGVPAKVKNML